MRCLRITRTNKQKTYKFKLVSLRRQSYKILATDTCRCQILQVNRIFVATHRSVRRKMFKVINHNLNKRKQSR